MSQYVYKDGITHEVASRLDYDHYKKLGYADVVINGQPAPEPVANAVPDPAQTIDQVPSVTEEITDADLKVIQKIKKISKVGDLDAYAQKLGDKVSAAVEEAYMARRIELDAANNKDGVG